MGRSRGGFSTKVHAVTTTGGKPLHVALTPGQQHESTMAEELLVHAEGATFIADTGYDADRIRANVRKLRMKAVIHSNPSRKRALPLDRCAYPKFGRCVMSASRARYDGE
ncbi:transposase [Myxococcus hansupus]|uniref:transposase n=1 Tax=Pseudomyxococcus hansupus TaxID=1297742 RepID=UPI0013148E7E|nr:transposase [Myxococcus hansupus]